MGKFAKTLESGAKELLFGFGGINFVTTAVEGGRLGVLFREVEQPRKIGERMAAEEINGKSFEELKPEVHFVFNNTESIDALVELLMEVREIMEAGEHS